MQKGRAPQPQTGGTTAARSKLLSHLASRERHDTQDLQPFGAPVTLQLQFSSTSPVPVLLGLQGDVAARAGVDFDELSSSAASTLRTRRRQQRGPT